MSNRSTCGTSMQDGNKVVTRVGYRFDDEGNKIRVAKRTGEDI